MGVMDERSSRIFVGVCLLVLLWIGTYWLYEPGRPASRAEVSFDPLPIEQLPSGPDLSGSDPVPLTAEPANVAGTPDRPPVGPGPGTRASGPELRPVVQPTVLGPRPTARVIPPEFKNYTIRPGDSFESIARDQLGSASLWTAIANANPLKDPRRLRVGEVIRVPLDPDNIQGKVVEEDSPEQGGDPRDDEPQGRATSVEYTVRPGDSLTRIARSYYGSVRFADAIYEANRDRLSSPDALSVGQVLLLPPLGDAGE